MAMRQHFSPVDRSGDQREDTSEELEYSEYSALKLEKKETFSEAGLAVTVDRVNTAMRESGPKPPGLSLNSNIM